VKIKEIELENFRCYRNKKISFLSSDEKIQLFNVIIGDNATGKTTILEGIAKAFIPILRTENKNLCHSNEFKDLTFNDMRIGTQWTKICVNAKYNNKEYRWHNYKRKTTNEKIGELGSQKEIKQAIENRNEHDEYPLVVYYSVERMFKVPKRSSKSHSGLTVKDALDSALTTNNEFRRFYNWFWNESYQEMNQRAIDKSFYSAKLKAVKNAIESVLKDYNNLEIKQSPSRMIVSDKNGIEFNVECFSGGYKAVFALVSDIASRLAMAYPMSSNPLEGHAIILIDELDLHLHPKWQKSIVSDLKRTFPNCQFIITTHSPFIVQTLNKSEVINLLDDDSGNNMIGSYEGYDFDFIQELMGVNPQNEKYEKMVGNFYEALSDRKIELALEVYSKIKKMVSINDKVLALMKLDLINMGYSDDLD